ncbi:MAG: double-strand break repair protein AddB [Roseovarius sp.]|uniref:double-strand break repair protein AddB n=1 Tax=Roseovarius sp. TaxID=1486281 RepID=UPI0032ECEC5B
MFEPSDRPRVFAVPLGVDFPAALVRGLSTRTAGHPPETLARARLLVNTRRMARRIRTIYDAGPAALLPRIGLVTDLGEHALMADIPDPVSPLRRRLELLQLVSKLLDAQPDLAPRSALYDLADSLAGLMDEMHGEGVSPDTIAALDVTDQSGHWARIQAFLGIVRHYFEDATTLPDVETRQRLVVETLARIWAENPPQHPIIVAGSTGSRGATQLLMQTVARLPQGAVILPGFDRDMPPDVWDRLNDPKTSEDHPQYRFAAFLQALDLSPADLPEWSDDTPASPERNRLVSLALRPAPITDQWRRDGPNLAGIEPAMAPVTLLEAPSPRAEALAIALRLRDAAETGQSAALITPDRTLSRQVTASLDRWGILPDDSAGMPLHLAPVGRFLRHVAELFHLPLSAEALLTLLKHPLTHTGADRGPHLRLTRELELHIRRHGPPYPTAQDLHAWAAASKDPHAEPWAAWLVACFTDKELPGEVALEDRTSRHIALAEHIARGADGETTGKLWADEDGAQALRTVSDFAENAPHGGAVNARDYATLFHAILSRGDVRKSLKAHPLIRIWGTLEARVQGADLLILAGLNEGSWPEAPSPDPWLNRDMRAAAGLLLPERRIGLAAHDFQQALLAPEVWITRSIRSDDTETVPSRWLNRLQNLLSGLPEQGGRAALYQMRQRGQRWLDLAKAFENPGSTPAETRPSPKPPTAARPKQLSVTQIQRLIRDPYAIYARHVLRLKPLDPLMRVPDALLRGTVIHEALERFILATRDTPEEITRERLIAETATVLAEAVPWADTRAMWQAKLERAADTFIEGEHARRQLAQPAALEAKGAAELPELNFRLTAKADRIDIDPAGNLHLYDYKTGRAPGDKQQKHFDKQLLLSAAIATQSGFAPIAPSKVARATFISLGSGKPEEPAPLETEPPEKVWTEFRELIARYMSPDLGYTSRRALEKTTDSADYDQLARFGEWDITDDPDPREVGQ